ncbi:MAG TPA: hypothetical protein VFP65_21605 [Anaeromyxobacteraceae bacterium]|nr:hypothetical protein [Anaeromyxobacteraceae bacterium]
MSGLRRRRRDERLVVRAAPHAEAIERLLDEATAAHGGAWPVRVHAAIADALGLPRGLVYAYLGMLRHRHGR